MKFFSLIALLFAKVSVSSLLENGTTDPVSNENSTDDTVLTLPKSDALAIKPLEPVYPKELIPNVYNYPQKFQTFRIDKDREDILSSVYKLVHYYRPEADFLVKIEESAPRTRWHLANYWDTFIQSYPSFLGIRITPDDFLFLTIFAISLAPSSVKLSRFYNDSGSKVLALLIAALLDDSENVINFDSYSDYVDRNLATWAHTMIKYGYPRGSFYTLEVVFFFYKNVKQYLNLIPQTRLESFQSAFPDKIFSKPDVSSSSSTDLEVIFAINEFEIKDQIVFRVFKLLEEETNEILLSDAIKLLIKNVGCNFGAEIINENVSITLIFESHKFGQKLLSSPKILAAFSAFLAKIDKDENYLLFKLLSKFLYFVFGGTSAEINLIYDIFVRLNFKSLESFNFAEIDNHLAKQFLFKDLMNLMNSSLSELGIADLNQSNFINLISFLILRLCNGCIVSWTECNRLVKSLVENPQIDPYNLFIMALSINPAAETIENICGRIDGVFGPFDYSKLSPNPQKWTTLRDLIKSNKSLGVISAILGRKSATPIDLMLITSEIESQTDDLSYYLNLFDNWIILNSVNALSSWNFNQSTLNTFKIETRIGDYPNSYQLVDSTDPIFESVYPLSLALILGHKHAIMTFVKNKTIISADHWDQATQIASMGHSQELFAEIQKDLTPPKKMDNRKTCIIS